MEKTIELSWFENEGLDKVIYQGKVTMKRLNFSEKNMLEEESATIQMIGTIPKVTVSVSKMKELSILKSVVKNELMKTTFIEDKVTKAHLSVTKEYALDIDGIKNLPSEIGMELFGLYNEINSTNQKKNEKSNSNLKEST